MKSEKIKIGDINFNTKKDSLIKFTYYSTFVTSKNDNQSFIIGQQLNKKSIITLEYLINILIK